MKDPIYCFGPFRLAPAQRMLFHEGRPLRLGSRALDILNLLVERAGEIVSNDELVARVWPTAHVEEGSLRVHVAALRKTLRDGGAEDRYIVNVPGRGYSFVAPIARKDEAPAPDTPPPAGAAARGGNLPALLTRVIGRADIVAASVARVQAQRFLTIVGPGGIGKTTVALAVGEALAHAFPDGVWFVGLSTLSNPQLVPDAVVSTLGQAPLGTDSMLSLTGYLRPKRVLIVLDNCEHVVEAAAALAAGLLRAAPAVHILATSREPLRADGEWIQRLPSLALPPRGPIKTADAMSFPAVQLFTDRALASQNGLALGDDNIETVIEICRQLDGIPLAIEFAAARAGTLGLQQIALHLDDRFALLRGGRRTAPPRHQTLRAVLDWSYDLLAEDEAALLRQLAVFVGDFSLDAAMAVAGEAAQGGASGGVDQIANLVGKSLIAADFGGEFALYRLQETTRLYALEKLRAHGEHATVARRHAVYYRDLLASAEAECEQKPQLEWLATYAGHIGNVRAGLDWAFSPEGDAAIGIALTVAAVPLWVQLSLLSECRERVECALAALDAEATHTMRWRMQLSAALGWSAMYDIGRARDAATAWTASLELADRLDDRDYRLRALCGLCVDQFNNGDFKRALVLAERFDALVRHAADPVEQMMGSQILATALHFLGDQKSARHHIDRVTRHLTTLAERPHTVRFRFNLRVSSHYFLARILWLQGFADQALAVIARDIEEGFAIGHALTLCSVLGQGAGLAYLAGDLAAAQRYANMLLEHTERYPVRLWHLWACSFNALVQARRGDLAGGLRALRHALDQAGDARLLPRFLMPLGELAALLGEVGELDTALATVDDCLVRCTARNQGWYLPELLRIKGEVLARASVSHPQAEACFDQARGVAIEQGALAWQLRASLGLARLRLSQGRKKDARAALEPVVAQFTEGFGTADLRAAKELLA